MKILYFTASGNSLHIAKSFGGEALSIPQMVKEGRYEFTDDKIGIVFPIHSWTAPLNVVDFLKKATFKCNYLFAVATYGAYSGGVSKHLREIASEIGYQFSYINKIKMIDNYVPTFDMKKQIEKEPKIQIEKKLAAIKADVESSKEWILKQNFVDTKALNYMINRGPKPFNKKRLKMHAMGEGIENYLFVDDTCNQCGTCAKVCPVDNIEMDLKNGKIALSDKCFMCFACVHNCSQKAIHVKGEINGNRYRNKNIKLKEIIEANK